MISLPPGSTRMDTLFLYTTLVRSSSGLVENMAGYACPHCGEVSDPFGSGGAEAAAGTMGLDFLGRVPLSMGIRLASDGGVPPAAGTDPAGEPFHAIAAKVADWLDARKKGS